MPYSDPEKRRAMQTRLRSDPDWKVKNKRWQSQYRFSHKPERIAYTKQWKKEQKEKARRLLGNSCYLSRYLGDHCKGIFDIHNKNGNEHRNDPSVYIRNIDEFVLLCRRHHKFAHDIALNRFGMSWSEFLEHWGRKHDHIEDAIEVKVNVALETRA